MTLPTLITFDMADPGDLLQWPFGQIDGLNQDDIREAAFEIFFLANSQNEHVSHLIENAEEEEEELDLVVKSKMKRILGLRTRRPAYGMGNKDEDMTSVKLMRQQMGLIEDTDNRLREALNRVLVRPEFARRPELAILPLELLRHVTTNDFPTENEYNSWHRRQLKILEVGLITHPFHSLDRYSKPAVQRLNDMIRFGEIKPIDIDKKSDSMRILAASVQSLANRNPKGMPVVGPHWADGFPLNMHLYIALLRAIYNVRDETMVLDEVDELLELIKNTWVMLGMNIMIHNVCLTWVLIEQYVVTGQIEPDLLSATLVMLSEVAKDAKSSDGEPRYVNALSLIVASMQAWAEKKLLDYHEWFQNSTTGTMENVLYVAHYTKIILSEDACIADCSEDSVSSSSTEELEPSTTGNRVEHYIQSSVKNAFNKIYDGNIDIMVTEVEGDPCEVLMQLARWTEELVKLEKNMYYPVLKNWHPFPTAIAIVTLNNCFCSILRQYVARMSGLTNEFVRVLKYAEKLEKNMIQMATEDLKISKDGGKSVVSGMIPFEVDSIIRNLIKGWLEDRLRIGRDCINKARETETWHLISKERKHSYTQSAFELMKVAKTMVDDFLEIQVEGAREELLPYLVDIIINLVRNYVSLVTSVGQKEMLPLPPLTRCKQTKLLSSRALGETRRPRLTISRSTQRLYVRLNTLHYILSSLNLIDRKLSLFTQMQNNRHNITPSLVPAGWQTLIAPNFDQVRATIQSSIIHVAEVAASRLIFSDMASDFYEALYVGGVSESRLRPALRDLETNLKFLMSVVNDQTVTLREVMKSSFEAFTLVLLAGGASRVFLQTDYLMIYEDLETLKMMFCAIGVDLVTEEVVAREAATIEGVVSLMAMPAKRLIKEFVRVAGEGHAPVGEDKMPIPPTPSKWNNSDPNTILRVLCHRDEKTANRFLETIQEIA